MMNSTEATLFKVFMWVMGGMATAIFAVVSLTYKSQLDTAKVIQDHISVQVPFNQYVIRRMNADSTDIIHIKAAVFEMQLWIKTFEEKKTECKKLEAILPKEQVFKDYSNGN
jgi:hypothetical protein